MSSKEMPSRRRPPRTRRRVAAQRTAPEDALQLILIPSDPGQGSAQLLATYGSARVLEVFETKGRRWREIATRLSGRSGWSCLVWPERARRRCLSLSMPTANPEHAEEHAG